MTERQQMEGVIKDISTKRDKNGNEFVLLELLQAGNEYPTRLRCFNEDLVPRFANARVDQAIGVEYSEKPGTYEGKAITYRTIEGLYKASEQPPSRAPSSVAQAPTQARAGGWTEAFSQSREHAELTRASIERQYVFGKACEGVAGHLKEGYSLAAYAKAVDKVFPQLLEIFYRKQAVTIEDEPPVEDEPSEGDGIELSDEEIPNEDAPLF
jgi:hypothetical protein